MGRNSQGLLAALFLALVLPGCATITTSTNQSFTVLTEPDGARCELRRGDVLVAYVNPTPGTVQIGKSSRPMQVRCIREGHASAVMEVQPEFQPMFLGNILIGGLVGVIVDTSTGAIAYYPDTVRLALAPNVPPLPDGVAELDARIEALRADCAGAARPRCATDLRALERERTRLVAPIS